MPPAAPVVDMAAVAAQRMAAAQKQRQRRQAIEILLLAS
jgi:hypothetical protein